MTRVVSSMNRQMNLPLFQHLTREFERQTDMMDLKEEMVDDAIGSVMEDDGGEEETDALVQQVNVIVQNPILCLKFRCLTSSALN